MVAYSSTPADPERGEHPDQTLALVQTQSWLNRTLKIFGGVFFLALALALVFVVVWTWSTRGDATAQNGHSAAQFQTKTDKTDPHSTLRNISSKAKAAIHLQGTYEEGGHSGLQWYSGLGQGFSQGGIQLQNNRITIPESGVYFVYSQASFRVSCHNQPHHQPHASTPRSEEDGRPQRSPLSHGVWRFSDSIGTEVSLMSAVRSACSGQEVRSAEENQGWYNAIYLGAVFQLQKGDRLWTETNQLSELETEEGKTFFGVFALF
ncbi:hypothetical protein NL108_015832 [Boleophthalmus pectinirostris]|uniref:tumor necrosis factor b (TNF superfamily, member 2) n=1 Tax=Boleophthalmus pectinirostris TaxID=150288 RepID=UPI0024306CDD|nr:tumor necrosis factor b (TNF superfamily, member 2) [Boleophthalmus pectinirostris]KAJ0066626.1 hypothetical protein NL108_015832 [Boleophthalmus pectinirostris]